jgi:hypothetical protein
MLSVSPEMQLLSKVSEGEERENSIKEYEPFKVLRGTLPSRAWSIYVKNAYLADCP